MQFSFSVSTGTTVTCGFEYTYSMNVLLEGSNLVCLLLSLKTKQTFISLSNVQYFVSAIETDTSYLLSGQTDYE